MTEINPEALRSAIQERIQLAEAASRGPWVAAADPDECPCVWINRSAEVGFDIDRAEDARFIAAHDPSFMLRVYRQWLDVLDRHKPWSIKPGDPLLCFSVCSGWPCPEVRSVAAALGVPVEEGTTDA